MPMRAKREIHRLSRFFDRSEGECGGGGGIYDFRGSS